MSITGVTDGPCTWWQSTGTEDSSVGWIQKDYQWCRGKAGKIYLSTLTHQACIYCQPRQDDHLISRPLQDVCLDLLQTLVYSPPSNSCHNTCTKSNRFIYRNLLILGSSAVRTLLEASGCLKCFLNVLVGRETHVSTAFNCTCAQVQVELLERFTFYERAKKAFAVVATG